MKRPILKRTVKTIEVVTWTLEYEDVAEFSPPPPPALSPPLHPDEPILPPEIQIPKAENIGDEILHPPQEL